MTKLEQNRAKEYKGIKLSPTSINMWRLCPRKFFYHYVIKLPTVPSINLVKGGVEHTVLEKFFGAKFKPNIEEHIEEIFNKEWSNAKISLEELKLSPEELEQERQDCINMLSIYIRMLRVQIDGLKLARKAGNDRHAFYLLRPKFREKYLEDLELNVCGFIDRVYKDFDGIVTLGDYKTSNRFGIGIRDEYEVQNGIYALLYKRILKKYPDFTSVIFLRTGQEVRTPVTPGQIKRVLDIINEVNKKTKSNKIDDYHCKENPLCKWCDYFPNCSGEEKFEDEVRTKKFLKVMEEKDGKEKTGNTGKKD